MPPSKICLGFLRPTSQKNIRLQSRIKIKCVLRHITTWKLNWNNIWKAQVERKFCIPAFWFLQSWSTHLNSILFTFKMCRATVLTDFKIKSKNDHFLRIIIFFSSKTRAKNYELAHLYTFTFLIDSSQKI